MKRGKSKRLSMLLGILLLLAILPNTVGAMGNLPVPTGVIRVKLPELETPKEGATFAVAKVGDVTKANPLEFTLSGSFTQTGVNINNLKTAEALRNAAQILTESGLAQPLYSETLTANQSEMMFDKVEQGVYLFYQTNVAKYARITPVLVFIPYITEDNVAEYSLIIEAKGEVEPYVDDKYEIKITKVVKKANKMLAVSRSFYVALFADQDYSERLTEVKRIKLTDESSTTVVFTGLEKRTYYIEETDQDGNVINTNSAAIDFTNEIDNVSVTLDENHRIGESVITNHLKDGQTEPPTTKPTEPTSGGGGGKDGGKGPGTVKTGDTTPIVGFVLLAIASLALIVAGAVKKRKTRNQEQSATASS